jgi:O-antigen ligase
MSGYGSIGLNKNSPQINSVIIGLACVTIYFKSDIMDPFNSPKQWILILFSTWLIGYISISLETLKNSKVLKQFSFILVIFIFVMLIDALNTTNLYNAFFGESFRKNGFLSYLSLTIFSLTSAIFFRKNSINKFYFSNFLIGSVLGIYGLMQHLGKDFVVWNNQYNNIIGTVGNPNFAAALMAVIAVIAAAPIFNSNYSIIYKLASLVLVMLLSIDIYFSNARQGIISLFIGLSVYATIWVHSKSKKIGLLFASSISVFSIIGVLGMLQIGPLTNLIYKESVSLRGYYWRAGIEMFKHHPIFGVGIDSYGYYFKEFREVNYSLVHGMTITSTNAHNTFIQMFATGGLFLGTLYLLIVGFIFKCGVAAIRENKGNDRLVVGSIFSAWIAFQSQSVVSIDNLGISIWGFILGGIVVGLSLDNEISITKINKTKNKISKSESKKILRPFISLIFLIPVIILITNIHSAESLAFQIKGAFSPVVSQNTAQFYEAANKALAKPFLEDFYRMGIAGQLVDYGFTNDSLLELKKIVKKNPRDTQSLEVISRIYEIILKEPENAINYRVEIAKYDPWNAENFLILGRDYKLIGDYPNMDIMLKKIISFAPDTLQAKSASTELLK